VKKINFKWRVCRKLLQSFGKLYVLNLESKAGSRRKMGRPKLRLLKDVEMYEL
jgi:hypothetical protein